MAVAPRRTKIVATLGPASSSPEVLAELAQLIDGARLNFSHGTHDVHAETARLVREAREEAGRPVALIADLQGPKLRIGKLSEPMSLERGDEIHVAGGDTPSDGCLPVSPAVISEVLKPGHEVLIDDGHVRLLVRDVERGRALCTVVVGGEVTSNKGVNVPGVPVPIPALTRKDTDDLEFALGLGVDYVALSFVRSAADVRDLRALITQHGSHAHVIAKIEKAEAIDALGDILEETDAVMVARGDLGVEIGPASVPLLQKRIILRGLERGKPVITATQMLESMVRAPTPTRAEVSDVANAVFDGTSAVMLSGETAIGHDPVAAVATMARIARRAEQDFDYHGWGRSLGRQLTNEAGDAQGHDRITAAVSAAGYRAALDAEVSAIIACTNSGTTARAISRFRPTMPILAATPSIGTARQLSVAWGITPMLSDRHGTTDEIVWFAVEAAVQRGMVRHGDVLAVLVGSPSDLDPATDTLRLVRVR
jgi:pyruvate kinase